MTESGNSLFFFGRGYVASRLVANLNALNPDGLSQSRSGSYTVVGATYRAGGEPRVAGDMPLSADGAVMEVLSNATHIIVSAPPQNGRDPVLDAIGQRNLARLPKLRWVGYLSSTGVYGDYQGGWVDEGSPLRATGARSVARLNAEAEWLRCAVDGLPVSVFRLAGIYGPGRSTFDALRKGTARRIDKPGQVFSRCHVDDICSILYRAMGGEGSGGIYNVADDLPAPQHEVVAHAASLMGVEPPPLVPFDAADLSPAALSFYDSCRRVRNNRIKEDLGVTLAYPTYVEGLRAIAEEEEAVQA